MDIHDGGTMNESSRRGFLKVAGVGAAAAGVAALAPAAAATAGAGPKVAPAAAPKLPAAATGSMVAYIDDVTTGEVSVMVEGREVTITDHQMVAKLAHAMHSPKSV
jgi:hypothetical protein